LKIAVLGTGNVGSLHLKTIESIPGLKLVAVPMRSSRLAELEGQGLATAASLQQAMAIGVGAAIVATDTSRHVEDVISALSHELDVLVEKPTAVDAARAH